MKKFLLLVLMLFGIVACSNPNYMTDDNVAEYGYQYDIDISDDAADLSGSDADFDVEVLSYSLVLTDGEIAMGSMYWEVRFVSIRASVQLRNPCLTAYNLPLPYV